MSDVTQGSGGRAEPRTQAPWRWPRAAPGGVAGRGAGQVLRDSWAFSESSHQASDQPWGLVGPGKAEVGRESPGHLALPVLITL